MRVGCPMDFQSAMETFAEAWVAANAGTQTQALALTRPKSQFSCPNTSQAASPTNSSSGAATLPNIPISFSRAESPQRKNSIAERIIAKPNTLNLALMGSRDNLSSNSNHSLNCSTPSQAVNLKLCKGISAATSPLLENGKGGGAGTGGGGSSCSGTGIVGTANSLAGSAHERSLTSQSPHDFRKEFEHNMENAKSLPLHCIVESTTSIQTAMSIENRCPLKGQPNIETDSYVIMPAMTPFSELLNTALQLLGYSAETATTARGSVIIKNWKPLSTEQITDNPLVSVGDILGELTSVVTLRILVLRAKPSIYSEIKDKLLKLLILQSHPALRSTGCPLDEITLSTICRGNHPNSLLNNAEITEEMFRNFDQWWTNQLTAQANSHSFSYINSQKPTEDLTPEDFAMIRSRSLAANREAIVNNHKLAAAAAPTQPHHPNFIIHPAMQSVHSQYPNQKTRMRTSFDPEMELPKLQRWFHDNPHPSRQQIQSYVFQLNALDSRRGRKPLDVNNVVYWFKNARAAQKRAELRGQGISNGFIGLGQSDRIDSHHAIYVKSPQSMKSEDIDNMSQHSDDMDDELERVSSPQLPLSLTIHERRQSPESGDVHQNKDQPVDSINSSSSPFNNNCLDVISNCADRKMTDNLNANEASPDSAIDKSNSVIAENNNDSSSIKSQKNSSTKDSPQSDDDLDMEDPDLMPMEEFLSPSPPTFPMLPNSMFSHSIMYMSHYIPQMNQGGVGSGLMPNNSPLGLSPGLNLSRDERRKRNRTFIDPVTEVPKLEQWFSMNTHPSHNLILKYTEDLNRMPYRQKFPRLESKNVQFWFKNRRAKCKRLKMSLYDGPHVADLAPYPHAGVRE